MEIQSALARALTRSSRPAVTYYDIAVLLFTLYKKGEYRGKRLSHLQRSRPDRRAINRYIDGLMDIGVLEQGSALDHREAYLVLRWEDRSAAHLFCSVDPFAYMAHLSAMEFHGLTDRVSKVLCMATPIAAQWRAEADKKMYKDLGEKGLAEYRNEGLPRLHQLHLNRVKRMPLDLYRSSHWGAFTHVYDGPLRVATIGRTFLQMIKEPDRCGGIYHVVEVYEEHAAAYLDLITAEVDRFGAPIDKVRVGYLLEEVCELGHPILDSWRAHVKRGGSRKLYAPNEYSSKYSENWSLSINI